MTSRAPRTRAEARSRQAGTSGRSGRPTRRAHPWRRRIGWALLTLVLIGVAAVTAAFVLIKVPQPNDLAMRQATVIYYSDGKTELDRLTEAEGNREAITIDKVPEHVRDAVIAAEDRSFYDNSGISPTGIARAVWTAVTGSGGATQGGSTITQQYVKNYFLTQDRTLTRKVKEMVISIKIDGQQSKDEILQNYLNTIYYGRGAYGIQTAARAYYGKDVSKLTVSEGAFLASVINAPSLYDPDLDPSNLTRVKDRWTYVVDGMASSHAITPEQRAELKFAMPKKYTPRSAKGTSGYVSQMVKRELISKLKLSDTEIANGGLRIVTTIDRTKQRAAEDAVKERMPSEVKDLKVGLASIVPGDGAIRAIYGGSDYAKRQQNSATQDSMQGGSTFKIFTLIAALQSGDVSIRNTFPGYSPQYFEEFRDPSSDTDFGRRGGVKNFGYGTGTSYGTLDLRGATQHSVNTIYARLNIEATPKATAKAAQAAGITSNVDANYGNVFGTSSVTVLDMANAYATIAAEGVRATPYVIAKVTSNDGSYDYTAKPNTQRVFDKDVMADVITCMRQVTDYGGTGAFAANLGRPSAGKTGTTSDNKAAWFDGYVPQLATAVGIYRPGPNGEELSMSASKLPQLGYEITGGTIPVRIWTDYMTAAMQGTDIERFPEPAYVNRDAAPAPAPAPQQTGPAPQPQAPRPTTQAPTTSAPSPTPSATPSTQAPSPSPPPAPPTPPPSPRPPRPTPPAPTPTIPQPTPS